ncbi:YqcI/YcgG family protein [Methyloligella halotolerans]|uniref:YqcI/YcgG family protein n=2 Tax=Methyloligella halotolerans TaxID=1177755 RepID=A0A1E2S0X2_9HYPH|nr:YqcI/YcgG family protein [Methyloligella halotolerans]
MSVFVGRDLRDASDDADILHTLRQLVRTYRDNRLLFQSLAILFEGPRHLSEQDFETCLWTRLQSLSDGDAALGYETDESVSADPEDPHFSLSFAGEAFFVVGLHPNASRPARQFETPAMVFNLHDQFEELRRQGRYEKLRDSIVARDVALAGSQNPMLATHGEISEARQYSGRAVEPGWECPFAGRKDVQPESV